MAQGIAVGACILTTLMGVLGLTSKADAQATELLLSEYIEGSSNNKALEIYNGTSAPINLSGYTIEMYFNATPTAGLTHALSGTIAPSDVFVLSSPSATLPAILAASDQTTSGTNWFNGNDSVVLKKNGVIIDSLGQIASNPATEWGTGLTSTADNTLQRKSSVCLGDTNPNNAFDPALEWDGFANDFTGGLGTHTTTCGSTDLAPSVSAVVPTNGATVGATTNITITWSEAVTASGSWYTLNCGGGNVSASESGSGATRTLDPSADLPAGATCTLTIVAAQVLDVDGTPTAMSANYVTQFNVAAGCGTGGTRISAVQGSGSVSPLVGSTLDIEGIVVGDFQGSPDGLGGFNVQEEAADQDGNAATSEGVFVFDDASAVAVDVGDVVRVRGTVQEYFNLTELTNVTVVVCSKGAPLPAPTNVTLPVAAVDTWERWEGMLVSVNGPAGAPLVVSETYADGQYGELTLSASRQYIPTNLELPGSAAAVALADLNARSRIQLDDGRSRQNPATPVPIPYVGVNGTLRLGDSLTLGNLPEGQRVLTGTLGYAFEAYEINPTIQIVPSSWTANNPRPASPSVSGRLKVVSMNTLNYFQTLDVSTEAACASAANCCGPGGTLECRGAQTASELTRQEAKLQANMKALNADVYALQEIENNAATGGRASELALSSLVALLNTSPNAPGTYDYVATGAIGGDAIKVGLIYKVATVQPDGALKIIDNATCPTYRDHRSRPTLVQTFREVATGAKFTAAVVHLKSKGSSCASDGDPLDPNGQGECNGARLAAVSCLRSELAGSNHDPDVLVLGDVNAYSREDPITYLESNGYIDVLRQSQYEGPKAYDYVFMGETGALSHVLASASAYAQITGAQAFHTNADEPRAFDYNDFNQAAAYAPNPFRAADHDPLIIGLNLRVASAQPVPALGGRWLALLAIALVGLSVGLIPRSKQADA